MDPRMANPGNMLQRSKRGTAAMIHSDVAAGGRSNLEFMLDSLLNPAKAIDELDTIDWCKWLMAGGKTPEEFSQLVRRYDNATTCGLVWTANFVAYRCRTCGISPCMSLCAECFQRGDHDGHDFNMFRSQAGGACDCGDTSVMKDIGFCDRHGPKSQENKPTPPKDLMCVTEAVMPRIILRLIQHLRENSKSTQPDTYTVAIQDADAYLTMLHDLSALGAAMRRAMTVALTNREVYKQLTEPMLPPEASETAAILEESQRVYEEALRSLPNPEPSPEHKDIAALQEMLSHQTFLEELVFWTVKFEFPQKVVCLLLNMLPDPDYKEALTEAFVLHYSRISMMLEKSLDPDTLSNRVVHVSVQLFSNEELALRMVDRLSLLHVMVISLKYMMSKILIKNTLHDPFKNDHYVVDCARPVMKEHCYWPLVSDLNNVLSHNPVAVRFMSDDSLLETWFNFLSMFQGMNVNLRELSQHVEFEPNTYYAAFSAELEASAYPMWALLSHLRGPDTVELTRKVLSAAMNALQDWFDAISMTQLTITYNNQVSFHLPLHRYLAVFMCQAVNTQGLPLRDVLPPINLLHLIMIHPLRVQVAYYEILNGLWVRNGLQIKGQAMTYVQCNFCNSMVDADLYLLQVCATILPPHTFIQTVLYRFQVVDWLSLSVREEASGSCGSSADSSSELPSDPPMLESCLTFLASLVSLRTNLGGDQGKLSELELVTLLCMGDKTHSQLMELMPERCGTVSGCRDFESVLARVAEYKAPGLEASGAMQQGMYSPKPHVWLNIYDPIHVLLRAVHRRDFQSSMDRYNQYVVSCGRMARGNAWPPYREPSPPHPAYADPRRVLKSKVFHAVAWIVLYKALTQHTVTEHVISLVVYLLEMAVAITLIDNQHSNSQVCSMEQKLERSVSDGDLECWFESDWLSFNLRTVITSVSLPPQLDLIFDSDSDDDWRSEVRSPNLAIGAEVDDPLGLGGELPLVIPSAMLAPPSSRPPSTLRSMEGGSGRKLAVMGGYELVTTRYHGGGGPSAGGPSSSSPLAHEQQLALPPPSSTTSSSSQQMVLAGPAGKSGREGGSGGMSGPTSPDKTLEPNESLISLLLKLHSSLAGAPDSFDPDGPRPTDSVGDGPHFVGKLLHRIMSLDDDCREAVARTREALWPRQPDDPDRRLAEARQKEERRRRARERQQKVMEEFASRQKQFMQAMETDENMECGGSGGTVDGGSSSGRFTVEYDCVICNQSSVSTVDKPMGLAVLVQATSVLGARRRGGTPALPTSDAEHAPLKRDTMREAFDERVQLLDRQFDELSWRMTVNSGWEGGVHVQTCGHHLHLDCLKSYLRSLRSQQRLLSERGEYACPLCRQLANSVLPLLPASVPSLLQPVDIPHYISSMLRNSSIKIDEKNRTPLEEALFRSLDDLTNATTMYGVQISNKVPHSLYMFVTSTARINLEIEVTQRGGSLVTPTTPPPTLATATPSTAPAPTLVPKRSAISGLLQVLKVHSKVLVQWPVWEMWNSLLPQENRSGVPWNPRCPQENRSAVPQSALTLPHPVPILLTDPSALLSQFLLLLPAQIDIAHFTCIVKTVYNLMYFQAVVQLSYGGGGNCGSLNASGQGQSLDDALSLVRSVLEPAGLYSGAPSSSLPPTEHSLQTLCLPFLRLAALFRHHLFSEALPEIQDPEQEFLRLVYYLELVQDGMSYSRFNGAVAVSGEWSKVAVPWLREVAEAASRGRSPCDLQPLLAENHLLWSLPKLLTLPNLYDKIFQYYHRRQCSQCQSTPRETSICLLCGTIVCLKESCCKRVNICEAVQHSMVCGSGTAMYLVVTSSYVIVIRGKRACLWGSVYLDTFGEEDRELKRGKPLYLSASRYELLQQQWLAHRFDHTNKKWVWHRDAL